MATDCAAHLAATGLKATVDKSVALCPTSNQTCFLNAFRGYTSAQANEQKIKFEQTYHAGSNNNVTAFYAALIVFGLVLCFFGWKLAEWAICITGFSAGAYFVFYIASWLMNLSGQFNCWILVIAPLFGGLIGVCLLQKCVNMAFFVLGAYSCASLSI